MTGSRLLHVWSVRDLFLIIITVASVSILITYHVSQFNPQGHVAELSVWFQSHVKVYHGPQESQQKKTYRNSNFKQFLNQNVDQEKRLWLMKLKRKGMEPPSTTLMQALLQIEEEQLYHVKGRVAIIKINTRSPTQNEELYWSAFMKAGFTVVDLQLQADRDQLQPLLSDAAPAVNGTEWTVLLCLMKNRVDTDEGCLQLQEYQMLLPHQRVNYIPGFSSLLDNKKSLCETMTTVRYIPVLKQSSLSPVCYNLPSQAEEFLQFSGVVNKHTRWLSKPVLSSSSQLLQVLQPSMKRDVNKVKEVLMKTGVVQEYIDNPLLLYGMPFSVTTYVLVTSTVPLRAYIYPEARVSFRHNYQRGFKKIPGREWGMGQLLTYLKNVYGINTAQVALSNLHSVVVQTLLATEAVTIKHSMKTSHQRCHGCYQLLGVDLIYNSSFHPIVTEVNGHPDVMDYPAGLLDNMVAMVFAPSSVSADVAHVLQELNPQIGIQGSQCISPGRFCLSQGDLGYLLSLRREMIHRGYFQLLYPSAESSRYSQLIQELETFYRQYILHEDNLLYQPVQTHTTAQLHPVLVKAIRYLTAQDELSDQSYDDVNIPVGGEGYKHQPAPAPLVQNVFHHSTSEQESTTNTKCSEDEETVAFLASIQSYPALKLTPTFNPQILDYYATVPYATYLVKLRAFAQSCNCEARLEHKYGLTRPSNFTLGFGENRLTVVVVDVRHSEPWVLNTYTIHVMRQEQPPASVSVDDLHQVCSLQQHCDMPFLPREPCGLQKTPHTSWSAAQALHTELPACQSGDHRGEWLVPCGSCEDRDSCQWSMATWQPYSCRYPIMPHRKVKECLDNKQVLFIGDSTNRGMMNYLVERVNGTLSQWDKTHDIKVYDNVNSGKTTVSFAYYPQFWLPAAERPVFDKAFYQLLKRTLAVQKHPDTVIVVGGVHWLTIHHLSVLQEALKKVGLGRVRLVMKTLGAGFHQPVDGLHYLTLTEEQHLLYHNLALINYAKRQGFEVVDTFNMTMARYQDFLQGKCACHFHRVREILPSFTELQRRLSKDGKMPYKAVDIPVQYHVEGSINAVYSEILINRICDYEG